MGTGTLLLTLVCFVFVIEVVQCWFSSEKETDCQIKTTDDDCCVFPFYYKLRKYYGCTTKDHNGIAWCGTQKFVLWGHGGWGECAKPCDSSPCKNHGICENVEDSFSCTCTERFEGKTCEEKVNPCDSSPCKNGGTCESMEDSFSCTCGKGFEGKTCEEKVNPCDSSPCKNGGICESVVDSFNCTCSKGFEGKTCEEKVNPCDSSPCKNNGICETEQDSFSCLCAKGFEGKTCEEKVNPCDSSPCKNNGICEIVQDSFSCTCAKGFEGNTCEEKVNPCDSSPCKNDGTCESVEDSFSCTCAKGFEGKTCEKKVNPCDSSPCKNEGTCESNGDSYICKCAEGFEGERCERKVNPCNSSPCKNKGRCQSSGDSFTCKCAKKFKGKTCEEKVTCDKPKALGMASGGIPNSAIKASTAYSFAYRPYFARLNRVRNWCSWSSTGAGRVGSWLQVDFRQKTVVTGVATQGSCYRHNEWAKSFSVTYSNDAANWAYYRKSGLKKVFKANTDRTTVVKNLFKPPIFARYIRILPQTWNGWPTMRIEFYGCHFNGNVQQENVFSLGRENTSA